MKNTPSLNFYPLSILRDEKQGFMIGRSDIGSYAQFPEDAVMLLKQLQQGMSLDQAAMWYEQCYGESVDIEDFLMTLQDLQFIHNGEEGTSKEGDSSVPWQRLGCVLFSPSAWIFYCILFGVCLYAMFHFPALVPSSQDIFFSSSFTFIEIVLLLFQILAVSFHELYHVLAGRRLGIATRITVSHRLGTPVLETSLTRLWSVPRQSRYLPLLAGMLADSLIFSACIVIAWIIIITEGGKSSISMFFLAIAYITIFRFLWQFSFYLRTDLYYVIVTALGCVDLQNTTRAYARNLFFKFLGQTNKLEDETVWHPQDRQAARWFIFVYLVGYGFSIGVLLFIIGPLTLRLIGLMITRFAHGILANPGAFLDSVTFVTLNLIPWFILSASMIRKFIQWKTHR